MRIFGIRVPTPSMPSSSSATGDPVEPTEDPVEPTEDPVEPTGTSVTLVRARVHGTDSRLPRTGRRHCIIGSPFQRADGRVRLAAWGFRSMRAGVREVRGAAGAEEDAATDAG